MATQSKVKVSKKEDFRTMVVDYFNTHNKGSFNYKQVSVDLGITGRTNQYMVADILDDLTRDGFRNYDYCRRHIRKTQQRQEQRCGRR